MAEEDKVQIESTLERKRKELVAEIHLYAGQLAIQESESDPLDRLQSMTTREHAVTIIGTLSSTLSHIDAALRAISEGTYGVCVDCEESIAIKRLKTIPWASRCVPCQERLDDLDPVTAVA